MDVRRELKSQLGRAGSKPLIMEDEQAEEGEFLKEKFHRLAKSSQAIICYWPPDCVFDATEDEIILLDDLAEDLKVRNVMVVMFVHESVASPKQGGKSGKPIDPEKSDLTDDTFLYTTTIGAQSAYFGEILQRIPCQIKFWNTHEELNENVINWWNTFFSVL